MSVTRHSLSQRGVAWYGPAAADKAMNAVTTDAMIRFLFVIPYAPV
jgi:hypothetical protein